MAESNARKPLISGNWKMHHNHFEAIQTVQKLAFLLSSEDFDAVEVSVHPPFTDIRSVQITLADQKATEIALGAQTCHWDAKARSPARSTPPSPPNPDSRNSFPEHPEPGRPFGKPDEMVQKK